jgi:hypothetical protein
MVPPATVRKLAAAASLLVVGFALAGRIAPIDAVGVVAFAVGAVATASTDPVRHLSRPLAAAPLLGFFLLLGALGFAGFGDVAGLFVLVAFAGAAGAVVGTL